MQNKLRLFFNNKEIEDFQMNIPEIKKSIKVLILCVFLSFLISGACIQLKAASQGNIYISSDRIANIYEKLSPSVVRIKTENEEVVEFDIRTLPFGEELFERFFGEVPKGMPTEPSKKRRVTANASGTIISCDGYILTNYHVIEGARKITVITNSNKEYPAKVIGKDRFSDLAVIKINAYGLVPAPLGNSSMLRTGDWVTAIGSPLGFSQTITLGIVSALSREVPLSNIDFIQTDAAINPGNSGGPLVNIYGEVIGINTAIVGRAAGIGFAIPVNIAKEISGQLIAGKVIPRPWIGLAMVSLNENIAGKIGLHPKTDGVFVTRIIDGAPAQRAGVLKGDVIISINSQKISSPKELQNIIRSKPINKSVLVQILRKRKVIKLKIKVEQWPEENILGRLR